MGSTIAHCALALLIFASILAGSCMASRDGLFGFNYTDWQLKQGHDWWHDHPNKTQEAAPNKIVVGGSEQWHFGFNYTNWTLNHGPFYLNDVLVFKYDPPSNGSHPHSVYLLPDLLSFIQCNMSRAEKVAETTQGGGEGFEFPLKSWKPYYFACGGGNGVHCDLGLMKFFVVPMLRGWNSYRDLDDQ